MIAVLLGLPALASGVLSARPGRAGSAQDTRRRITRAAAVGLTVWLATGVALFSHMARLHPRYVEGLVPAVAALLGIGVAWAGSGRGRARLLALAVALAATVYYVERLLYGRTGVWWLVLACAFGAISFALLARVDGGVRPGAPRAPGGPARPGAREALLSGLVIALSTATVLAMLLSVDFTAIKNHVTDAGYVGALPSEEQRLLSGYLRAHQGRARYEVAAESATGVGSLIVQDARPIVVLTSYGSRVFTTVAKLEHLIAEGKVRYAFLNSRCGRHASSLNAACAAPARWVRAHGTDVSRQAGLPHDGVLWLLPGAPA